MWQRAMREVLTPRYVHLTHDHWLEGLKRISEARS